MELTKQKDLWADVRAGKQDLTTTETQRVGNAPTLMSATLTYVKCASGGTFIVRKLALHLIKSKNKISNSIQVCSLMKKTAKIVTRSTDRKSYQNFTRHRIKVQRKE